MIFNEMLYGGLNDLKCFYLLHFLYIAGVGVNLFYFMSKMSKILKIHVL